MIETGIRYHPSPDGRLKGPTDSPYTSFCPEGSPTWIAPILLKVFITTTQELKQPASVRTKTFPLYSGGGTTNGFGFGRQHSSWYKPSSFAAAIVSPRSRQYFAMSAKSGPSAAYRSPAARIFSAAALERRQYLP